MFSYGKTMNLVIALFFAGLASADVIDGEELVDPTRPLPSIGMDPALSLEPSAAALPPARFEVSFVRASDSSPIAVVNDRRVTIGDTIDNAQVAGIDRNGVTLIINGEETRITVHGTNIKSSVQQPQIQR